MYPGSSLLNVVQSESKLVERILTLAKYDWANVSTVMSHIIMVNFIHLFINLIISPPYLLC